jgi:hypothetical protein
MRLIDNLQEMTMAIVLLLAVFIALCLPTSSLCLIHSPTQAPLYLVLSALASSRAPTTTNTRTIYVVASVGSGATVRRSRPRLVSLLLQASSSL